MKKTKRTKRSFLCVFLSHKWTGCICSRCGKKRDKEHIVINCVCINCKEKIHQWRCISSIGTGGGVYYEEVTSTFKCLVCGQETEDTEERRRGSQDVL
jgi:hypothetical protein